MRRAMYGAICVNSTAVVGGLEVGQRSLALVGLFGLWTVVLAVSAHGS